MPPFSLLSSLEQCCRRGLPPAADVPERDRAADPALCLSAERPCLGCPHNAGLVAAGHGLLRPEVLDSVLATAGLGAAEIARRRMAAMQSELDAYKAALDQHAIVAITDRGGTITHANEPFCRISGYARAELIGQRHSIVNSGHHPREFFVAMWRAIGRGRVWRGEICNRAKDGRLYWVDTTIVPFHDERGRIVGYVSIRYDVTDRKQAEAALNEENARRRRAETLLRDIIETIPEGVAAFDAEERLILSNQAYSAMHEAIADDLAPGMRFEDMLRLAVERGQFALPESADGEAWIAARLRAFRKPGRPFTQHLRDGRWVQVRERRSPSGNTVGVRTDITELKQAEIIIKNQAEHDPLTGLFNRSVLGEALQRLCLLRGQQPGALVIADLDGFKWVNDTLGHDAGDRLLKHVAARLTGALRASDTVVRLGGDEFALILPRVAGPEAVDRLMRRIVRAVSEPLVIAGRSIVPQCSYGICLVPRHARSPKALLKNADIALYEAKAGNRGSYRIFSTTMRSAIDRREKLAAALRADLAAGRLDIALQPQVSLADGGHVGFEALARWTRAGRPVSPQDFIPIAEATGLIVPLGQQVLESALAAMAALRDRGLAAGTVAVNVAAAQLKMDSFIDQVAAMLRRFGVSPDLLEVEVTENVLLDDASERVLASLTALRRLGVRIALDDFGTGYASLTHLKLFPVDRLKIDREFVRDIMSDPDDAAICRAIVGLAHSLGLEVVAEGIETVAQASFLRDNGCDFGQGYLFGRPLAPSELNGYFVPQRLAG